MIRLLILFTHTGRNNRDRGNFDRRDNNNRNNFNRRDGRGGNGGGGGGSGGSNNNMRFVFISIVLEKIEHRKSFQQKKILSFDC